MKAIFFEEPELLAIVTYRVEQEDSIYIVNVTNKQGNYGFSNKYNTIFCLKKVRNKYKKIRFGTWRGSKPDILIKDLFNNNKKELIVTYFDDFSAGSNGFIDTVICGYKDGEFIPIYGNQIYGANAKKLFIDFDEDRIFELVEYQSPRAYFEGPRYNLVFDILKWNGEKYANAPESFVRNNLKKIKSLISIKKSINPDNLYWRKELEKPT